MFYLYSTIIFELHKLDGFISFFHVIFGTGNAYSNDVILTGEIIDDNNTEVVKLKCKSSKEPAFHAVEFFVDHITADTVKLDKGKCYNSVGECSEKICECLNAGIGFIWIFYPTDVLKKYVFGCQVRSFDEKNNTFKATATLQFDGSGNHSILCNLLINCTYKSIDIQGAIILLGFIEPM